ncbi:DUF4845 domain-containing protein [Undibacterium jejuense]|uniref:DUF4845 domain-containing protein n=1 Tax=Undibacterium jejuense TaxID=1344949 RepID=A0A923HB54_9BURK|nr:DUF4845 domain-containing protein [Undibacterium jejuense]MBC3860656.1 DUF4845 domain-containing protein [Undibacterium jejuense]
MKKNRHTQLKSQRGISLIGLIFSLGMLVLVAMVAMKVVPTTIEYLSIKKAIVSAKGAGSSARDIENAFNKQAEVGYITSISGKDLVIERNGDDIDVSFSYQKKIPLFGPASLLLEYEGTTAKSGIATKKPE